MEHKGMNWARKNWYYIVIAVLILIIFNSGSGKSEVNCEAKDAIIAELNNKVNALATANGKLLLKYGKPRPSEKQGCPDCPACPDIEFTFDLASGMNSANRISGTASASSAATAAKKAAAQGIYITVDPLDLNYMGLVYSYDLPFGISAIGSVNANLTKWHTGDVDFRSEIGAGVRF